MTYRQTQECNCPSITRVVRCETPDGTISIADEGTAMAQKFGVGMPVRQWESAQEKAARLVTTNFAAMGLIRDEDSAEVLALAVRLMEVF